MTTDKADKIDTMRINMIKQQCRTWDVLNPEILDLLQALPREDFVPANFRHLAFADIPLSLGHEQYMLTPNEEAKILDKLALKLTERVWEIGTGSGYFTALMAKQTKQVDSIDIFEDFTLRARQKMHEHHLYNVELMTGDGLEYHANAAHRHSPASYDVIVLTGSVKELPNHLLTRLNIGGRLFAFMGTAPIMNAVLMTKTTGQHIQSEILFQTYVSPLVSYTHSKHDKFVF